MNEDTVPEDIRSIANFLAKEWADELLTTGAEAAISGALLAERIRCANLVKAMLVYADTTSGADEAIPAAIMDPNHWLAKNPQFAGHIESKKHIAALEELLEPSKT